MIRKLIVLLALLTGVAWASAGAAGAARPTPPPQGVEAVTIVEAPHSVPAPAAALKSSAATAATASAYPTCWSTTARNGYSDATGHEFIYQHITWCGNGFTVTYGSVWQSYDQNGWYHIGQEFGPWWGGGCIGCGSLTASGYQFWSWSGFGYTRTGTTRLNTTVTGYGSASASG